MRRNSSTGPNDLRERVDWLTPTKVNTEGEVVDTFGVAEAGIRAAVREERASERVRLGRTESRAAVIVVMNRRAVKAGHQLRWRGDTLRVQGEPAYTDASRRRIECLCVRTSGDDNG